MKAGQRLFLNTRLAHEEGHEEGWHMKKAARKEGRLVWRLYELHPHTPFQTAT